METLSMNKDRHIISEIRGFFAESDNTKAIQGVMNVMDHIQITQRQMGFAKAENCKFTVEQIFRLAVLFPFFSVKTAADYADSALGKLFSCKKGNGSWNALITTNMGIDAKRTFELYARRWCIEVAHKEMKGLLNLGNCQCVDFAGQIAALSPCMIQYNILGTVMRFESYETIGGLFTELTGETVELTSTSLRSSSLAIRSS